jgi:hypothetical protein
VFIRGFLLECLRHSIFKHQCPEFSELFIKRTNFLGEGGALGGGDPLQTQTAPIDPQQAEQLPGFFNDLLASDITVQVMTIANVSAGNQDTVGPFQKRLEQKALIDPASAHKPDQTDIGRILHAGHSGQIRPGVSAPVADKGDDVRPIHIKLKIED